MNYRPRRLRITLLLCPAFVAGLAIGPVSDMVAKHFLVAFGNTALAQNTDRTNTYGLLTLFGDVFQRVRSEYVDPVSDTDLINNAIKGMLTGLDPHSSSMNAAQFRALQEANQGRIWRPWHRGHPGEWLLQGNQCTGRHARIQGGYQGRRHRHGTERQDNTRTVTRGRARPDAWPSQLKSHVDHQA